MLPILLAVAANDLPLIPPSERARERTRERRLRGPVWSTPTPQDQSA